MAFRDLSGISFVKKNTKADPNAVPAKGINNAVTIAPIFISMPSYDYSLFPWLHVERHEGVGAEAILQLAFDGGGMVMSHA